MILSDQDIKKIAHLARIDVSDEQVTALRPELGKILTMIEHMDSVDTQNVAPLSHPIEANQRLRLDEVTEINQRDTFQKIAPNADHGLYFVPLVIE